MLFFLMLFDNASFKIVNRVLELTERTSETNVVSTKNVKWMVRV